MKPAFGDALGARRKPSTAAIHKPRRGRISKSPAEMSITKAGWHMQRAEDDESVNGNKDGVDGLVGG